MVAAMIPKGKMMANMLKREDAGSFSLVKFQSSEKESGEENTKVLSDISNPTPAMMAILKKKEQVAKIRILTLLVSFYFPFSG